MKIGAYTKTTNDCCEKNSEIQRWGGGDRDMDPEQDSTSSII